MTSNAGAAVRSLVGLAILVAVALRPAIARARDCPGAPTEQAPLFADRIVAIPGGEVLDELDLGVELRVNDQDLLTVAYVGANLVDESLPSHAVYLEARLIPGR